MPTVVTEEGVAKLRAQTGVTDPTPEEVAKTILP
jgi:hypothetical protein